MARRNRMSQPWGYVDETKFQGGNAKFDSILDMFFADAKYDADGNLVRFYNREGKETVAVDLSDLKASNIVEDARYEDGYIIITFMNGDVTKIDVNELLSKTKFTDGLKVEGWTVSVKVDPSSENYISVTSDGIKLTGIGDAIKTEVERSESGLKKTIMEKLNAIYDEINGKADKNHEHTVEDVSDITLDGSGVVIGDDFTGGTIKLEAGRF